MRIPVYVYYCFSFFGKCIRLLWKLACFLISYQIQIIPNNTHACTTRIQIQILSFLLQHQFIYIMKFKLLVEGWNQNFSFGKAMNERGVEPYFKERLHQKIYNLHDRRLIPSLPINYYLVV